MRVVACTFFLIAAASAQTRFDSVDIRPSAPNTVPYMRSRFSRGRYEVRNATLVDLIRTAWNVDADNVIGGPDWLDDSRYDVTAAAPPNATPEALQTMLQAMLSDRFGLVAHKGSKDLPAYVITAEKKLPLQAEADTAESTRCSLQPNTSSPVPPGVPFPPAAFVCRNMTMAAFAAALPGLPGVAGYLFGYRVVDRTGLNGAWNFSLRFSPRYPSTPRRPATDTITLFDALERQMGLVVKLSAGAISTPVVVVDSVASRPSAAHETARPADLPQFEVADIKRESPDVHGTRVGVQRGGEVHISGTLRGLIAEAWGDMNPDRIVDAPKFIDGIEWSLMAKTEANELPGPAIFNGLDVDTMRMMLRSLLLDRFGLKAHFEDRPLSGYALVTSKPKLRPANPANRPGCHEAPGDDGKDPRIANPMASRLITCRNMTVSQFAAQLNNLVSAFPPIADSTGLTSRYDLTINFTPPRSFANLPGPDMANNSDAPEPDGAISLSEALNHQLGLKLESHKVKAPVLVIDHVNEIPTEN